MLAALVYVARSSSLSHPLEDLLPASSESSASRGAGTAKSDSGKKELPHAKPIEILVASTVIRNAIHANFLNHTPLLLRPTKATGPLTKPRILVGPRKDRAVAPNGRGLARLFERRFAVPVSGARSSRALCYPVANIE